jgi:hypothetical protein
MFCGKKNANFLLRRDPGRFFDMLVVKQWVEVF